MIDFVKMRDDLNINARFAVLKNKIQFPGRATVIRFATQHTHASAESYPLKRRYGTCNIVFGN